MPEAGFTPLMTAAIADKHAGVAQQAKARPIAGVTTL
jgi:hypothetical protein